MSSIPVFIGSWQDHSRNSQILGYVVTLDVKWGGYLIAALSTFVGLVGTAAWSLVAFWIHQYRARNGESDLLFMQHQAIYRNQGSSFSAALDMFKLCWYWRKKRNQPSRVEQLKTRSMWRSLPPVLIFLGFSVAGLFIANVAGATYRSNDVKIAQNRCGFWQYNVTTPQAAAAAQLKVSNETVAARAYSRNCYGSDTGLAECGLYPVQSLPISTNKVPCPFGDDPTGHALCRFGDNEALQFDTGLLDSSSTFGINAPKPHRILVRKMVTCSPIYINNYYNSTQSIDDTYIDHFYLGPITDANPPIPFTWSYHQAAALDQIPYQVQSVYTGGWDPVEALQVSTGDVSLYFIAQNTVGYITPVNDLLFAAHQPVYIDVKGVPYVYGEDQFVNVLGCVDQLQICNPNSSPLDCTVETGVTELVRGAVEIGLNVPQLAAVERLVLPLDDSTTYITVNSLSSQSLLAQDQLHGLISSGLPDNQWEIEVRGWFSTSLAKLQAGVTEFAANIVDLGPYGYVQIPGTDPDPTTMALESMCSQQRIRNTGGYQTFSVLGLAITIGLGSIIIILSWTLESCVQRRYRKNPTEGNNICEVARVADQTLQLQRMALLGAGHREGWDEETLLDHIPVTVAGTRFPLPTRENAKDKDYQYSAPQQMAESSPEINHSSVGYHQNRVSGTLLPLEHLPGNSNQRPGMPAGHGSQQPLMGTPADHRDGSGRDASDVSDYEER